jgi:hypothetical protein
MQQEYLAQMVGTGTKEHIRAMNYIMSHTHVVEDAIRRIKKFQRLPTRYMLFQLRSTHLASLISV